MRTLIIIIALVLIFIIAKRLWQKPRPPAQSGQQPGQQQGKMLQCANCGIYIPEQEAFHRGDRSYCSQAHLDEDMHN
jgi:uncharacterized protein